MDNKTKEYHKLYYQKNREKLRIYAKENRYKYINKINYGN